MYKKYKSFSVVTHNFSTHVKSYYKIKISIITSLLTQKCVSFLGLKLYSDLFVDTKKKNWKHKTNNTTHPTQLHDHYELLI